MKKEEFLAELEDILQREEACKLGDILENYDEWDSLSKMAVMAYYDKTFGIKISLNEMAELKTVDDLIKLAEGKIE